MFPRNLQADAVVCPCEEEHRPVYPVRYAYSNLYADNNAKASLPPTISALLDAASAEQTKGFSARLLRTGWVYVFEEGDYPTRINTQGQLLIFKHVVNYYDNGYVYSDGDTSEEAAAAIETGDAEEGFVPYLRVYDSLSEQWRLDAQSSQYPYLPIKKDVMTARFLFSDIPLSDYTLNKIESGAAYRHSFMQEINLVHFDNNPYALEANASHIEHLVEEYKEESKQFYAFTEQAKAIGNPLPKEYFSHIASVSSITKSTQALLNQAQKNLDYNEKSSLIILHDPVGYQKEILSLYTFVTTTYAMFQHYWRYPNKVGHFVEKRALFAYPSSITVEHRPNNAEVVVKHGGMDYVSSRKTPFNDAFAFALGNTLNKALNSPMLLDGELVLNFDVEVGVFAGNPLGQSIPSVYWYYVIDRIKGDIAPLRFRDNNPNDKIYGCLDGEGTE